MQSRRAFTLVELLVVIAIIAILVALLIPAVQSARAAARKVHCANNFRQVALAVLNHASNYDRLPPVTDTRFGAAAGSVGYRNRDPTSISWRFTVLPYLEESAVYGLLNKHKEPGERFPWVMVTNDDPNRPNPTTPAVEPVYMCPSVPGNPRFGAYQLAQPGGGVPDLIFDGISSVSGCIQAVASLKRPNIFRPSWRRSCGGVSRRSSSAFNEAYTNTRPASFSVSDTSARVSYSELALSPRVPRLASILSKSAITF